MNIPGYVNPREIGNTEPNELFHMDIFIEDALWTKYVSHPNQREQNLRTFDVCSMLLHAHRGERGGRAIENGTARYEVEFVIQAGKGESEENFVNDTAYDKTEVVTLRAYQHPEVMALCVGIDASSEVTQLEEQKSVPAPQATRPVPFPDVEEVFLPTKYTTKPGEAR